jgi:hypothetical protein
VALNSQRETEKDGEEGRLSMRYVPERKVKALRKAYMIKLSNYFRFSVIISCRPNCESNNDGYKYNFCHFLLYRVWDVSALLWWKEKLQG